MAAQDQSPRGGPLTEAERGRELVKHPGTIYQDYLVNLVETKGAKAYFEIGTFAGSSLARISCASLAVDPKFNVSQNVIGSKPMCLLYQMTSDDFFAKHNPSALLGGPLDVAFLDGMHLYEYLLRDFYNTERHCAPDSLIVMHDCVPPTYEMAERTYRGATLHPNYLNYWTGDVWKIIPILRKYRPELKIALLDCPPTGLVVVGNLDPTSRVLEQNYASIVAEFENKGDDFARLSSLLAGMKLTSSRAVPDAAALAKSWR